MTEKLSYEYIRGLIAGTGSFSFSTSGREKIPAFTLTSKDSGLLTLVKEALGLRDKIYHYDNRQRSDGYKRQPTNMLIIRDVGQLKNIIIPLFYKKLNGNKALKFEKWIDMIGKDPMVSKRYRFIYTVYEADFYDKSNQYS